MSARDYEEKIKKELMPFTDVPYSFISALTKQRLLKNIRNYSKYTKQTATYTTSKFNEFMLKGSEAIHTSYQREICKN
jgi:GTP-binding protein